MFSIFEFYIICERLPCLTGNSHIKAHRDDHAAYEFFQEALVGCVIIWGKPKSTLEIWSFAETRGTEEDRAAWTRSQLTAEGDGAAPLGSVARAEGERHLPPALVGELAEHSALHRFRKFSYLFCKSYHFFGRLGF